MNQEEKIALKDDLMSAAESSYVEETTSNLTSIIKSMDNKFHQIVYNPRLKSIEFTLLKANQQLTDKFVTVQLNNLLGVRYSPIEYCKKSGLPISVHPDSHDYASEETMYLYYAYRSNIYNVRMREIIVRFIGQTRSRDRDNWIKTLKDALNDLTQRPKQLIIFINPFGGKRKALSIWEKEVEPFFLLSEIACECVLTTSAGHAGKVVKNLDVDKWNSVDGFITILSSAVIRTQDVVENDTDTLRKPRMRFGIIGAGSANSIVASIHGVTDIATAAIHIAIGSMCGVDICSVSVSENHRNIVAISANAISYGWLGDTLHHSENYRFMGPIRYQWSALCTSIRHPTYFGRVSFALSDPTNNNTTADEHNSAGRKRHVPNLPKCVGKCDACDGIESDPNYPFHWQTEFTHVICCHNRCISPFTPYGLAPFAEINDGSMDLALIPRVSRLENLRIMSRVALFGGRFLAKSEQDLNIYRVSRWKFTPKSLIGDGTAINTESIEELQEEAEGAWNIDGEIFKQPIKQCLYFRLHPGLINFFGKSNIDLDDPRYQKCFFCKRKRMYYSDIIFYD